MLPASGRRPQATCCRPAPLPLEYPCLRARLTALASSEELLQGLDFGLGLVHVLAGVLGVLILKGCLRLAHVRSHAVLGGGDFASQIQALLAHLAPQVFHAVFGSGGAAAELVHLMFQFVHFRLIDRRGLVAGATGLLSSRLRLPGLCRAGSQVEQTASFGLRLLGGLE